MLRHRRNIHWLLVATLLVTLSLTACGSPAAPTASPTVAAASPTTAAPKPSEPSAKPTEPPAATQPAPTPPPAKTEPVVLKVGWLGKPDTLNPAYAFLTESYVVFDLIYNPLVT